MSKIQRFFRWIEDEKDPYFGNMELKPQKEHVLDKKVIEKRKQEKQEIHDRVYDLKKNKELHFFAVFYRIMAIVFCLTLIGLLLYTVSFLPPIGDVKRPVNNEVAEKYIMDGREDTGAINIVTGMILDYRAFDTLGESHVLFIATITVLILLRLDKKGNKNEEVNDRIYEPKNDSILQTITFLLVPMIMIFGIYVVLNGHLSPGGGFSGGAIMGAGLILYLNAFGFKKTERFFTEKTYKWICFGALSFYCIAKSYSFYTGANHLESLIPLGIPGTILSSGLILFLNICVGLIVTCTMYAFYALFRKGGF